MRSQAWGLSEGWNGMNIFSPIKLTSSTQLIFETLVVVMGLFSFFRKSVSETEAPPKVLFIGLDNSGKSSLWEFMRSSRLVQHAPTRVPECAVIACGNSTMNVFDMGGHKVVRALWKPYFTDVRAFVFFVSADERDRFEEAKKELHNLLSDGTLASVPILILGNKLDSRGAVSEMELRQVLDVPTTGKQARVRVSSRPIEIFMISVLSGTGIKEALEWLSSNVQ